MSLLQYLQLQPIDPQDDGTVSDLDDFPQDEVIDLTEEDDGDTLARHVSAVLGRDRRNITLYELH